jgi:uncharacterized membrane protein HdeD (DUF308 family)
VANQHLQEQRSWWKLILTGLLAFAFGVAAVFFPADIMFRRILDVIFGRARPLSGSLTGVAALLALVAVVLIDGLLNLFGTGTTDKPVRRLRGAVGVAVAAVATFWPGITIFVAVELIGLWAVLIGILELIFARDSKDRAVLIVAGIGAVVIGIAMVRWVFGGAVLISAVVGVAAAARGVSLIVSGIHERAGLMVNARRTL